MMFHGFGYGMGIWGFVIMLLFWVAVIALGVWLVRSLISTGTQSHSSGTAKSILDTRYARGEISREEYQQMLEDLGL